MYINCNSCSELLNEEPNIEKNGLSQENIDNLINNEGLKAGKDTTNNEHDLNNMNDCLIGNLAEQIESYENCEWKDAVSQLATNIKTVLEAIIAGETGLWEYIDKVATDAPANWVYMDYGSSAHKIVNVDTPSQEPIVLQLKRLKDGTVQKQLTLVSAKTNGLQANDFLGYLRLKDWVDMTSQAEVKRAIDNIVVQKVGAIQMNNHPTLWYDISLRLQDWEVRNGIPYCKVYCGPIVSAPENTVFNDDGIVAYKGFYW